MHSHNKRFRTHTALNFYEDEFEGAVIMGVFQITVHGEAPQLFVGSEVGGAKIISIKDVSPKLVSASELAQQYGISVDVVRDRCAEINKGTRGKCLYDPEQANLILTARPVAKRGRQRKN
ncbi:MAG: hypothetical protein RR633_20885 [Acinetobacter sp.]